MFIKKFQLKKLKKDLLIFIKKSKKEEVSGILMIKK